MNEFFNRNSLNGQIMTLHVRCTPNRGPRFKLSDVLLNLITSIYYLQTTQCIAGVIFKYKHYFISFKYITCF